MYDSDTPTAIPSGVYAAGYVDGYAAALWAGPDGFPRFPNARRIAVFLGTTVYDGDSFDVENGDMTPAEAPAAVANAHARGIAVPWVYCNRSARKAVENALIMAGVHSDAVALWIATLDGTETVPPGPYPIAAVQYLNPSHGSGGHYDLSLVNAVFGPGGHSIGGGVSGQFQGTTKIYHLAYVGEDGNFYHGWANLDPASPSDWTWEDLGAPTARTAAGSAKWSIDAAADLQLVEVRDTTGALWVRISVVGQPWQPWVAVGHQAQPASEGVAAAPTAPDDDSAFVTKAALKTAVDSL